MTSAKTKGKHTMILSTAARVRKTTPNFNILALLKRAGQSLTSTNQSPTSGSIDRLESRELLAIDFAQGSTSNLSSSPSIIADLDGDGDGDLAVSSGVSADMLRIYKNNGTGSFAFTNGYDLGIAVIDTGRANRIIPFDADNDGDIDLLTRGPALWLNNGDGTFAVPGSLIPGAPALLIAVDITTFDYNNDALPDLMAVTSSGLIAVAINGGGGLFSVGPSIAEDNDNRFIGAWPNRENPNIEDVYVYDPGTQIVQRIINEGSSIDSAEAAAGVPVQPILFGWNTDTLPDLITVEGALGQKNVTVRKGTTDILNTIVFDDAADIRKRFDFDYSRLTGFTDVDVDGKQDLIVFRENGIVREWVALLNNEGADGNFDGLASRIFTVTGAADPDTLLLGRISNDTRSEVLRFSGNVVRPYFSLTDVEITADSFGAAGPNGSSQPTIPGEALSLTSIVTGGTTATNLVTFYVDSNNNGRFDENDRGIGQATGANGNDATVILPDGLPAGTARLFCVCTEASPGTSLSTVRTLTTTFWTRVFYPEGFRTLGNVNEHVPIVNPNNVAVSFKIILRYETGDRDQVYVEGVLPPNYRGGTTTSLRTWTVNDTEGTAPVRTGVGYAFEVQSSLPIGAQLARYDTFGGTQAGPGTGESFTNVTATQWAVADVSQQNYDFILFYNPYPVTANITMTFISNTGAETIITRSAEAFRRSGIAVQEEPSLNPLTSYSVIISSDQPIVTSHTRYRVGNGRGFTNLAQPLDPQGVSTASNSFIIPSVEFRPGVTNNAYFFNPSTVNAIAVTIRGRYEGTAEVTTQTINLQPRARTPIDLSLNAPSGTTSGSFRVTTDNGDVYVSTETVDTPRFDSNATTTASYASTKWGFSDGYLDVNSLGNLFQEYISLFNPNNTTITVTFTFMDSNNVVTTTSFDVLPESERTIALHTVPQLITRDTLNWFSTVVESPDLFIANMTHWDLSQPGGWTTIGSPLGGVFPIPAFDAGIIV